MLFEDVTVYVKFTTGTVLLALMITGCGGGGGSNDEQPPSSLECESVPEGASLTDEELRTILKCTNIDPTFNDGRDFDPATRPNTRRWGPDVGQPLVAVRHHGIPEILLVMDEIEAAVGYQVFDRVTYANAPDNVMPSDDIIDIKWRNAEADSAPGFCGTARLNWTVNPDGTLNDEPTISIATRCPVNLNVIRHEFGHAFGMLDHFDDFGGQYGNWSDTAWRVFVTLYTNSPNTPPAALSVAP